ncbi:hypothetical protein, partial [Bosea thiooxidans]
AYKPPIETAPPLSGAVDALHCDGRAFGPEGLSGLVRCLWWLSARCLKIEDRKRNVDGEVLADLS